VCGFCHNSKIRSHFEYHPTVFQVFNFKLNQSLRLLISFAIFNLAVLNICANIPDRNEIINNEIRAIALNKEWKHESAQKAIELLKKSAQDWEKIDEPRKAVFCLIETSKISQTLSDNQTIFQSLSQAISISEKNQLLEEEAVSSGLYAFFLIENSDKELGNKYSQKAFLISEKANTSKAKAYSYFSKAIYEYYYGKIQAAVDLFEKSAEFAQETDDIFIINHTLFYVGFAYIRNGYPYKAIDKMNSALKFNEKHNDKRGQALSNFAIATAYYYVEKQKAVDYLSKAELMFPTDFEWKEKARIYGTLGNLYLDLGYLDLAENNFYKAISNHEKSNYLLGKITILTLLADTFLQKSELEKAKQTYESALTLSKSTNDKFRIGVIEEGLGNIEYRKKNVNKALEHYFQALKVYNEIGVKLPVIENLIGNAYFQKGLHQEAAEYYISAMTHSRQNKDPLQLSESLFNSAKLNFIENNRQQAFEKINESISITDEIYFQVNNTNLKRGFLSSVFNRFELYIGILMRLHKENPDKDFALQALQTSEKSRARLISEGIILSEANFTKDANPETLKREKEIQVLLNTKSDKLTDLLSQNAEKSEIDKLDNEINELEHELEDIKANLKQNSPVYSAIKNPEPFDVKEFQKRILDENSILLEFSLGEKESYLWLVGKDEISSYILPTREEIESKVENLRELIAARVRQKDETIEDYQARIARADKEYPEKARQLSDGLFGQIADKLSNKRLIIVPDGKLHYFPVSALPLPNSTDDKPILLSNEVVYEPSASTLLLIAKNEKQAKTAAKNLLVFSDPVFSEDDSRFTNNSETAQNLNEDSELKDKLRFAESLNSLPRLTESKDEGDSILRVADSSKSDIFTGFAATRERFLSANVSDYKILHFATHGLINETRPELSGIIFSRFNENREKLDEVVRLQDIYGLNLHADLVVLSACETGIGKEEKGEGLLSLNNGFLQVGAKTVLSSLWKVEDSATVELMKNFYEILANENTTSAKALQKAQIKMWESGRYKSPFYWAAFTVQGDFTRKPDISKRFPDSLLIAVLSAFFLISGFSVYYFVWRRRKV
jgi:CHAT domain-containing protein